MRLLDVSSHPYALLITLTMQKALLFMIGLVIINVGQGQDTILANFDVIVLSNSVELKWTIKKGNTCDGISILRSKDSLRFNEIGTIPIICGSPDFAESFQFSDNNPIQNQTNYYRLQLGQNGLSDIIAVDFFKLGDANELLFPNPTSGNAILILNNLNKQEITIRVYDTKGNILLTETSTDSRFLYLVTTGTVVII